MRALELFRAPKHPSHPCEDVVVVTDDYAAVIDGATDKSGLTYQLGGAPVSSGAFAAHTVAAAVETLPPAADITEAVAALSAALDAALTAQRDVAAHERPSCSVVVYSRVRHEVWSVGDCAWSFRGRTHQPGKDLDVVASGMRAAVLAAHLAAGADPAQLAAEDPGRVAILPLLTRQGALANTTGPFSYGVVDGRPVPATHRHRHPLTGSGDLVLASDGYPVLAATLAEAETELARLLAEDPLCTGVLRGTKPVAPGADSFDDRSWLRLAVTAPPAPFVLAGQPVAVTLLEDGLTEPVEVDVPVAGDLPYPQPVADAVAALTDLLTGTGAESVSFHDGSTVVFTAPPQVTGGRVTGRVAHAGYFAKSLARGTVPERVRAWVEPRWPAHLPTLDEIPGLVDPTDPLFWPAAGFNFAVAARTADQVPCLLLHQRSLSLAVNPGRVAAAVAEGLDAADVDGGRFDLHAAVRRGAAEELGATDLSDDQIRLLAVVRDDGPVRGYQFLGVIDSDLPMEDWLDAYRGAPDGAEADEAVAVTLTGAGVAGLLLARPFAAVTGPTLALLARALARAGGDVEVVDLERRLAEDGWGPADRHLPPA